MTRVSYKSTRSMLYNGMVYKGQYVASTEIFQKNNGYQYWGLRQQWSISRFWNPALFFFSKIINSVVDFQKCGCEKLSRTQFLSKNSVPKSWIGLIYQKFLNHKWYKIFTRYWCSNTLKIAFLSTNFKFAKDLQSMYPSVLRVKLMVTSTENFGKNNGFEYWSISWGLFSDRCRAYCV